MYRFQSRLTLMTQGSGAPIIRSLASRRLRQASATRTPRSSSAWFTASRVFPLRRSTAQQSITVGAALQASIPAVHSGGKQPSTYPARRTV